MDGQRDATFYDERRRLAAARIGSMARPDDSAGHSRGSGSSRRRRTRIGRTVHIIPPMPIVSVTRLHLASRWSTPAFIWYSLRAARQAERTPGFRGGWLASDGDRGYWTSTVWDTVEAMRAFRNSGTHLRVMPRLLRWCDEASYTHWEQPYSVPPTADVAHDRLTRDGRLSKVVAASSRHAAGQTSGPAKPRPGQRLTARHRIPAPTS